MKPFTVEETKRLEYQPYMSTDSQQERLFAYASLSNHASKKECNEKPRQSLPNNIKLSNLSRAKLAAHCHNLLLKYLYIHR
jgi:hypothetical protein